MARAEGLPVQVTVVSMPTIDEHDCLDDRFPAVVGAWVVGCGPEGRVDAAVHIERGVQARLVRGVRSPAVASDGSARLFAPGVGVWNLPDAPDAPDSPVTVTPETGWPIAPLGRLLGAAFDGERAAVTTADTVDLYARGTTARHVATARPLGEVVLVHAPEGTRAVWTERGPDDTLAVVSRGEDARRSTVDFGVAVRGYLAAAERWLHAVTDDGDVVTIDTLTGSSWETPADTGFLHPPSAWGPVTCWEDRASLRAGRSDLHVRCSDGVDLGRSSRPTSPSRSGPWVVFRESGHIRVGTLAEVPVPRGDPRITHDAQQPARLALAWPAEGWTLQARSDAGWRDVAVLARGAVSVEVPAGVDLRIVVAPQTPSPQP